jgi:hypothetical protein
MDLNAKATDKRDPTIPINRFPFTSSTYPGRRPRFSFFLTRTGILRLTIRNLDQVLENHGLAPASERYAVLAYGSNACPEQLVDKGLSDVPVIFGRMVGAEAVYAKRIAGKGYVPATLARKPGSRPSWVTLLTNEQLRTMDETEGRLNDVYVLAELPKVRFFVGQKRFAPLYTYVNIRGGVMSIKGKPVGLRTMAQRRAKTLLPRSLEKDAATLLDFNVISSPDPPIEYSRLIGSKGAK